MPHKLTSIRAALKWIFEDEEISPTSEIGDARFESANDRPDSSEAAKKDARQQPAGGATIGIRHHHALRVCIRDAASVATWNEPHWTANELAARLQEILDHLEAAHYIDSAVPPSEETDA